jgi:hypothetical protein
MVPGRSRAAVLVALAAVLAVAAVVEAQRGYFREGGFATRRAPVEMPDGSFVVCRLQYTQVIREAMGIGWETDYPYAEINLTTRLAELTKTSVSRDGARQPNYYVVRATDPALFNCPVIVASDVGTIGFRPSEIEPLREYFLKGGFLWVDDFWGTPAWWQWESEIGRILPPEEYPIEDVPLDDPLLHSLYDVTEIPQITNIQFWSRSGGRETSERGFDTDEVHLRAIRDHHRRIMVLMTHNTDVADSWEREGEDPAFFYQFSPKGYALGIYVMLHILTH